MAAPAIARRTPTGVGLRFPGPILAGGLSAGFLTVMVLLPIAALVWKAAGGGWSAAWQTLLQPANLSALELTVGASATVVAVNAVFGTALAWVLVRDNFFGKALINGLVDLPFALPTIVAGVTLLALYGPASPVHVDVFGTQIAIGLALLFVTLPFVARAVQPVLITMDREMEEAAAVLGAGGIATLRRILWPNLAPAILAGCGLAFARALGEYGSVVIMSSNLPGRTQVMSLVITGYIQQGDLSSAAALSVELLLLSLVMLTMFSLLSRRLLPPE